MIINGFGGSGFKYTDDAAWVTIGTLSYSGAINLSSSSTTLATVNFDNEYLWRNLKMYRVVPRTWTLSGNVTRSTSNSTTAFFSVAWPDSSHYAIRYWYECPSGTAATVSMASTFYYKESQVACPVSRYELNRANPSEYNNDKFTLNFKLASSGTTEANYNLTTGVGIPFSLKYTHGSNYMKASGTVTLTCALDCQILI